MCTQKMSCIHSLCRLPVFIVTGPPQQPSSQTTISPITVCSHIHSHPHTKLCNWKRLKLTITKEITLGDTKRVIITRGPTDYDRKTATQYQVWRLHVQHTVLYYFFIEPKQHGTIVNREALATMWHRILLSQLFHSLKRMFTTRDAFGTSLWCPNRVASSHEFPSTAYVNETAAHACTVSINTSTLNNQTFSMKNFTDFSVIIIEYSRFFYRPRGMYYIKIRVFIVNSSKLWLTFDNKMSEHRKNLYFDRQRDRSSLEMMSLSSQKLQCFLQENAVTHLHMTRNLHCELERDDDLFGSPLMKWNDCTSQERDTNQPASGL